MAKSWRTTALVLFFTATLCGGLVGSKLHAVGGEARDNLRLYTEILQATHDSYGADIEYRELVYASIQGMLRSLDPHTNFLSPEAYENMRQRQQGSFFGLGILVSMRNGQLTVISPIEGTPAWRLGLRAGDVISTIEGESTTTMSLDEAVDRLKGPKDTEVNISILRRGLEDPLPLTITRAEIPQNTVRFAYMLQPETGYIRLTDFSRSTAGEMRSAVDKLREEGMQRLVLDLRSNGGGLLDQTIEVSNLFVPTDGRIVETRGRTDDSYQTFIADSGDEPIDIPLVVLVNNGTASAAEILAGAVQDHDVGLVVGEPTWGKGLVQTVYNLSYGAGIALTTAKYYTPSGRLIQRDYSSYYDYYTHFDIDGEDGEEIPDITVGSPEFTTDLGRKVYGGGGITPDVMVELPELPSAMQFLFARNAFFDFAVDYTNRQPPADAAWEPEDGILEAFNEWLKNEELLSDKDLSTAFADPEVGNRIRLQLQADILHAAFGAEAAHRVQAQGDVQIQTALSLFDRASDLLAQRHEVDDSRLGRLASAKHRDLENAAVEPREQREQQ